MVKKTKKGKNSAEETFAYVYRIKVDEMVEKREKNVKTRYSHSPAKSFNYIYTTKSSP